MPTVLIFMMGAPLGQVVASTLPLWHIDAVSGGGVHSISLDHISAAAGLDVSAQSIYNWTRLWKEQGLCGLLSGHGGGRPRALSEAMLATAMEVARTDSMTLGQIAKRIEALHGEPMPCALETLSVALRREGFSFKRNRFSLKKSATRKTLR